MAIRLQLRAAGPPYRTLWRRDHRVRAICSSLSGVRGRRRVTAIFRDPPGRSLVNVQNPCELFGRQRGLSLVDFLRVSGYSAYPLYSVVRHERSVVKESSRKKRPPLFWGS